MDNMASSNNKEYNQQILENRMYAITITFKHLVMKTPYGQFRETAPLITKELKKCSEYKLVPEWRHTSGDIHYHGIIRITDYIKWHKSVLPLLKRQGFLCIKEIRKTTVAQEGWIKYYEKEIHIARGLLPTTVNLPLIEPINFVKKDLKIKREITEYIENVDETKRNPCITPSSDTQTGDTQSVKESEAQSEQDISIS